MHPLYHNQGVSMNYITNCLQNNPDLLSHSLVPPSHGTGTVNFPLLFWSLLADIHPPIANMINSQSPYKVVSAQLHMKSFGQIISFHSLEVTKRNVNWIGGKCNFHAVLGFCRYPFISDISLRWRWIDNEQCVFPWQGRQMQIREVEERRVPPPGTNL